MNKLVVKAVRYGTTIADSAVPNTYEYKKGEMGVVEWKWHPTDETFLEPVVLWDNDSTRIQRRFLFNDVLIVGLQNETARGILELAKSA
jgi:hypothetical protein